MKPTKIGRVQTGSRSGVALHRAGRRHVTLAIVMVALAWPSGARAQESSGGYGGSPFGIGFQSSWPAYGISGLYDVSDAFTAQAVLGLLGTVSTISGRGLYHFQRMPKYRAFGFGTVGLWRYGYGNSLHENTVGIGGGGGVELNWQTIINSEESSFPPLFSTVELGLTFANFDNYSWNAFGLGVGIHYRF